jgi:hypothetical protein
VKLLNAIVALSLVAGAAAAPVMAAPCKDAKGKFIKCPPPPVVAAKGPCKDAKGKFVKCPPKPVAPAKGPCKDAKGKFIKCT